MLQHSTQSDDQLLCGDVPASLDDILAETVDDVDVRDSVTLFFRPMRPCALLFRYFSVPLSFLAIVVVVAIISVSVFLAVFHVPEAMHDSITL